MTLLFVVEQYLLKDIDLVCFVLCGVCVRFTVSTVLTALFSRSMWFISGHCGSVITTRPVEL